MESKQSTPVKVTIILRETLAGKKASLKVKKLFRVTFSVLSRFNEVLKKDEKSSESYTLTKFGKEKREKKQNSHGLEEHLQGEN